MGYRFVFFAIIGWLALCGAREATPSARPVASPVPISAPSPGSKFTAYPGYDPDPCYRMADHDAADLCAQWRASIAAEKSAHEARRSATWSIIATFLSALSLGAVAYALKLTVESNNIARAAQRAWVRIELVPKKIRKGHPDGLYFDIDIYAENVGETVASHFELNERILFKAQDESVEEIIARIERQISIWTDEHTAEGVATLLPKDTNLERIRDEIPDVKINWWGGAGHGSGRTQVVVLAAVFYRTTVNPKILQISWRAWYVSDSRGIRPVTFIDRNTDELIGDDIKIAPFFQSTVHTELRTLR